MPHIVLTEEQTQTLQTTLEPVELRDGSGRIIRTVPPMWTEDEIAEIKRRLASDKPRHTFEEILEKLKLMETQ